MTGQIISDDEYTYCTTWFRRWRELAGDVLSVQRMLILLELASSHPEPITHSELGRRWEIDKTVLSRSIKALIGQGLVKSEIDSGNRSYRLVSLTKEGQALIKRLYAQR